MKIYKYEIEKTKSNIKNSDLVVFCLEYNSPEKNDTINRICVEKSIPWLSSRIIKGNGEIGPLVIPHKTSCFKCYEYRLKSNIDKIGDQKTFFDSSNEIYKNEGLNMMIRVVAGYTSLEILKLFTDYEAPVTLGNMLFIDFKNCTTSIHPILKIPYCPVCGNI